MSGQATREWVSEIDAAWVEMQGGVRSAVINIGLEGLARVTEKSPVDIGTFQNNWLVSTGSPDDGTTESFGAYAGRSAGALAAYASAMGWPVIYLQNNLPYANALENGSSSQAPGGVLGMTIAELEMIWSGVSL